MNPSFFLFKQTKVDENIVSKLKCSEELLPSAIVFIFNNRYVTLFIWRAVETLNK